MGSEGERHYMLFKSLSASNIHNQNVPGGKQKPPPTTKQPTNPKLKLSALSTQHSAKNRQPLGYNESQSFAKICLIDKMKQLSDSKL